MKDLPSLSWAGNQAWHAQVRPHGTEYPRYELEEYEVVLLMMPIELPSVDSFMLQAT